MGRKLLGVLTLLTSWDSSISRRRSRCGHHVGVLLCERKMQRAEPRVTM